MRRRSVARSLAVLAVSAAVVSAGAAAPPSSGPAAEPAARPAEKAPVAVGYGGAVASVDADASAAGIEVLRKGGNAVDAAVATAAALGVTEPYSAGIGGGGYFVYYDAESRTVHTIDGRETAPLTADSGLFLENGQPIPFADAVTSGLGVGTPGTPATWQSALDAWGSKRIGSLLKPAERLARDGNPMLAVQRRFDCLGLYRRGDGRDQCGQHNGQTRAHPFGIEWHDPTCLVAAARRRREGQDLNALGSKKERRTNGAAPGGPRTSASARPVRTNG